MFTMYSEPKIQVSETELTAGKRAKVDGFPSPGPETLDELKCILFHHISFASWSSPHCCTRLEATVHSREERTRDRVSGTSEQTLKPGNI